MKRLIAGVVAVACGVAAGSAIALAVMSGSARAHGESAPGELKAFQRPATASDTLPRSARGLFARRFGGIVESRQIATADGFRGRAVLYLVRLKRHQTCLIQIDHGGSAGGGCSPSRAFLSATRRVNAGSGNGFFGGLAGNDIARVAFVDRHWRLRSVRLTRDKGFLYACRNRNGCIDVIKAVNGYDRSGRLVSHQVWP
jgi:hypothetical protein